MAYLVTGGLGFIGSNIVDELLESGKKVAVIDNYYAGKNTNLRANYVHKNLKVHNRDICENLDNIFEENNFESVFHLAAVPRIQFSIDNPTISHRANVDGMHNLLDTCRRFEVKRFVFSSSSSVYGDQDTLPLVETMKPNPKSPYALHKLIGEQYCKMYQNLFGLEPVMLRYFSVYGPRHDADSKYALLIPKFLKQIKEGIPPRINGDGNQTRDFTHVSDVVRANILAANPENRKCIGEVINIGASRNVSINEITGALLRKLNSSLKPIYGPGLTESRDTHADIRKAGELLNWKPLVSLEDGLETI